MPWSAAHGTGGIEREIAQEVALVEEHGHGSVFSSPGTFPSNHGQRVPRLCPEPNTPALTPGTPGLTHSCIPEVQLRLLGWFLLGMCPCPHPRTEPGVL